MFWIWAGFIVFVLGMLALDLFVFHRHAHVVRVREALLWSAFWIALAMAFNIVIYFMYRGHWQGLGRQPSPFDADGLDGWEAAVVFFTGYVIEKSLSIDNLFVMALIFGYFRIPPVYQHRVLFWGIVGALVMRGMMIGLGSALIQRFEWLLYIFGAILLFTAYRMLFGGEPDPKNSRVLRLARKFFPITDTIHGTHFIVPQRDLSPEESQHAAGRTGIGKGWVLTPLALALLVVETTDMIFAVDSIPAIFAITTDPLLVFTSNIFAILGLRSLYFALAGVLEKFTYVKVSLAAILALVGLKMLLSHWLHGIPGMSFYLLGLIALILAGGVIFSLAASRRPENALTGARGV